MEFRSISISRFSVALLVLAFCGTYVTKSNARELDSSGSDEKLQQRLLAEILDQNGNDNVELGKVHKSLPVEKQSKKNRQTKSVPNEKPLDVNEIGTSVASVPTWPVMILVVFMAAIVLWLKKGGKLGNSQTNSIHKLAVVPLGAKRSLALVEVMGQKLVLGMSEKGLSLLTKIDSVGPTVAEEPGANDIGVDEDPFEQELRDILASEPMDEQGLPASVERVDLARKFRHLRNG